MLLAIATSPIALVAAENPGRGLDDLLDGRALRLCEHLCESEAAVAEVALRYLTDNPAEADRAVLMSEVFGPLSAAGISSAPEVLATKIDRDFRLRDLVIVHGWVLSRTEARLCALQYVQDRA